jgi:wobble nucleotide-excising tRNase
MGFLGFGKKDRVLDLTERYNKQQEKLSQMKKDDQEGSQEPQSQEAFSFLGNLASSSSSEQSVDYSNVEDKKKKLAKRLMDMTAKIEDLSNQIYHLQQRLEVLERKGGVGSY